VDRRRLVALNYSKLIEPEIMKLVQSAELASSAAMLACSSAR
jgi:hypothetical protein